jgi:hypothetical protein
VVYFDATRRTLPGLGCEGMSVNADSPGNRTQNKVLHGCRQLVS